MAMNVQIELHSSSISLDELNRLDFSVLGSDINFLARQPPLKEVLHKFRGKEIDYEEGHRIIRIGVIRHYYEKALKLSYIVTDYARPMDSSFPIEAVGEKSYVQADVAGLRRNQAV